MHLFLYSFFVTSFFERKPLCHYLSPSCEAFSVLFFCEGISPQINSFVFCVEKPSSLHFVEALDFSNGSLFLILYFFFIRSSFSFYVFHGFFQEVQFSRFWKKLFLSTFSFVTFSILLVIRCEKIKFAYISPSYCTFHRDFVVIFQREYLTVICKNLLLEFFIFFHYIKLFLDDTSFWEGILKFTFHKNGLFLPSLHGSIELYRLSISKKVFPFTFSFLHLIEGFVNHLYLFL